MRPAHATKALDISVGTRVEADGGLTPLVLLVSAVAAIGGFVFGYDIGGGGGSFAMEGFQTQFGWANKSEAVRADEIGWISALLTLGAAAGAAPSGILSDRVGRRPCIITSALIFSIGASLQAFASGSPSASLAQLYVGRLVGGFGVGMLSTTVPVYIAECAPGSWRGSLSMCWQFAIVIGIVVASLANVPLAHWDQGWRVSYGGNVVFALLLALLMVWMPESPRWLGQRGREAALRRTLSRLRSSTLAAEEEATSIEAKAAEEAAGGASSWRGLLRRPLAMRHRMLLGVALQCWQPLAGINAIMFFAPKILLAYFSAEAALWGTLGINVANAAATVVALVGVDRLGRVPLLLASGLLMCVCHLAMVALALSPPSQQLGYAVVSVASLFVASFAFGWGPLPWTVCSEIFPTKYRSKATAVTTATNWLVNTAVGKVFPLLPLATAFAIFAAACFAACATVFFFQPETANLGMEQIDEAFESHRVRRVSAKLWSADRRARIRAEGRRRMRAAAGAAVVAYASEVRAAGGDGAAGVGKGEEKRESIV
ncbi:hypothetical protein EMIHUDRAFT_443968 [Emiliania huxleyi CCMP1516]|uniref:Major facilitator superfamily (MFS) profile domain-containing protein n=2 Tax=Emiliania huxleyi TaxID=2903 RepID=A0A0D3JJU7_EMIH1|nr:hypothetical protein EMIHUDRAFT_443968 [Emiliania huxleyi CCMP1516]EOD23782.1 hypothetical protein EMIHUDRAFT_443968 [Emiliania huxleyi CCMP1516]|eukprot:XP_005776211.1 hypothetical protein EMIHUDRAFT_443968 [Emiliania huxleyi CCMP1516]